MIKGPKTTRIFALMLTWQCNLNCVYCFEKHKSANKVMSLETAKAIINKEFSEMAARQDGGIIKVEFFGGEPLLRFSVIKELTEWIKKKDFGVGYELSVTTNGSLLNDEMKAWFTANKKHVRMIMSVDGTDEMQCMNRGCPSDKLPIDFIRETWPDSYLKSTMSRDSLPTYGDGVIYLLEKGYNVASSIAVGVKWQEGDDVIYKRELEKLANYYLSHPEKEVMAFFNRTFLEILEPYCNQTPPKNCGTGTTMATYDVDGKAYPCHLFLPIVHGRNIDKELNSIDFTDNERMFDDSCRQCKLKPICRTCYGFNFLERGDVCKRDKTMCRMQLAEVQVISAFQIHRLMQQSRTRKLTGEELLQLEAAAKCYQTYKDFTFGVE
ncbi:MAG: 4Fe-4S cluster-binding domain-containing protein [Bacteroidaceae bacterium]|nr:4Fe-4S cluster-binding domain-containing protein [Bacteroidaceae bacterium]